MDWLYFSFTSHAMKTKQLKSTLNILFVFFRFIKPAVHK